MESSSVDKVELPATFTEAPIEQIVILIGMHMPLFTTHNVSSSLFLAADMLDRLKLHNDRIPLLPFVPILLPDVLHDMTSVTARA
jgi:hypothetical protein